jgi:hypothetical protein
VKFSIARIIWQGWKHHEALPRSLYRIALEGSAKALNSESQLNTDQSGI